MYTNDVYKYFVLIMQRNFKMFEEESTTWNLHQHYCVFFKC